MPTYEYLYMSMHQEGERGKSNHLQHSLLRLLVSEEFLVILISVYD